MTGLPLNGREAAAQLNANVVRLVGLGIPRPIAIDIVARKHSIDRVRMEWLLAQASEVAHELGEVS